MREYPVWEMGVQRAETKWREPVLEQVVLWTARLGWVLAVLAVITVGRSRPEHLLKPGFLLMLGAYGGVLWLRYRPGQSYERRAFIYCLLLWMVGTSAIYNVGLVPAPVLTNVLAVVSAGLFLGRRPMFLLLLLSSLGVGWLGLWAVSEQGWGLAGERLSGLFGVRLTAGYAVVTGIIALLVGHVVAQIERSLARTSEALRRLSLAEQHRSQAEQELEQTQSALQRSQKLEVVGKLAAGVGHDFNNSLQVVLSWASLLQTEEDPEVIREGLAAIRQAAVQGSELTQRLLTFGRRDVRAPRTIAALDLLEDGARSLRRMLPE
ncbi:MAG TPA: histidine kinase dimerization/phospho-acceptor domain-containing protein, partial [Polyangiaceae bacterium]|nr:histidine kinase dimerization/phospho-acceptor domain-containing protein [Polyangiaceae bacterium]